MSLTSRCTLAAVVLAVPVLAQVARPDLSDRTAGHLLFAASQLVGWALVAWVVRDAPAAARAASPRGRAVVLAGCGLQVAFAAAYGVTALGGEPAESSFVLFLLGFLALLVGGLLWAARLRRVPQARTAAAGLAGVAVLGGLAVLVGTDPFHDIFLVASYAAWALVGRGLTSLGDPSTVGSDTVGAAVPVGGQDRRGGPARH